METKATCPKCGSTQIQAISETETKGYDPGSGCCGAILLGPFGLLCGLCGMKSKTTNRRMCLKCGHKF